MSYQEKRTLTSLAGGILFLIAYCVYFFGGMAPRGQANEVQAMASALLALIGIGVGVQVVLQILFHIGRSIRMAVREPAQDGQALERELQSDMVEDEMHRLIERKAMKVGYGVAGAGFLAGLVCLALGWPVPVALHAQCLSLCVGSLMEGAAVLHYYRAGVRNG